MDLLRSAYWTVSLDAPRKLVRLTRTSVAYADLAAVERSMEQLIALWGTLDVPSHRLLLDSRLGPLRNDEAYEKLLKGYQTRLFGRFAAVAILIKTAVGKLHATRVSRAAPGTPVIFDNEAEALAYVLGGPPSR